MEDELISLETAIRAKRCGFDLPCTHAFDKLDMACTDLQGGLNKINYNSSGYMKSRPTQALLQRWFREVHNIQVFVMKSYLGNGKNQKYWSCFIQTGYSRQRFVSYEEALEWGLQEAFTYLEIRSCG